MDPNGEDHKPSLNNENESPSKNNEAKCVEVQVFNKLCDEVIKLGVEILKKDSENDTFADDEKILEQKILEEQILADYYSTLESRENLNLKNSEKDGENASQT